MSQILTSILPTSFKSRSPCLKLRPNRPAGNRDYPVTNRDCPVTNRDHPGPRLKARLPCYSQIKTTLLEIEIQTLTQSLGRAVSIFSRAILTLGRSVLISSGYSLDFRQVGKQQNHLTFLTRQKILSWLQSTTFSLSPFHFKYCYLVYLKKIYFIIIMNICSGS